MQRKIIIIILFNVIVISVTLSIMSYVTIHESIDQSLKNRLVLARIISNYVEVFLNNNLNRLNDISRSAKVDIRDKNWDPERSVLETVYKYSLFNEGVFILDRHGNKLLTYPDGIEYFSNLSHVPAVNTVLQEGKPAISNVYTIEPIRKKVIFIMTALKDRDGRVVGVAGGMLSPTDEVLQRLLQSAKSERNIYVQIIDSNEIVVASDNPDHLLVHHSHDGVLGKMIRDGKSQIVECRHGFSTRETKNKRSDLLAFVPLYMAPWGIIVGQSEDEIFAPSIVLQRDFIMYVLLFMVVATIISVVMSRKIVRPLRLLTAAANRFAGGDLTTPVGKLGSDEILTLSKSFDDMRERLAESLDRIRKQNLELENRVAQRTEQIRQSRHRIEELLKKAISSQEEERRRVARELHDTVLQDVAAFLIKLDICRLQPQHLTVDTIDEMRNIATNTIDNIHGVIKNLRPTILDDLGIIAAVRWLLNTHLEGKGIICSLNVESPLRRKLTPAVEITSFRILQETIVNISRHASARNVSVTFSEGDTFLDITVEDDGIGFDVQELIGRPSENGRGLGILGMKERASLIEGSLQIVSLPGVGTKVALRVPLEVQAEHV